MSGFLFALLAVFVAGIGARDQLLVAALAVRHGMRPMALLVALLCVLASGALAAAMAGLALPSMGPIQRQIFAALALALAGIEMLLARKIRIPDEPTHSLGAFALVLFAQQLLDAARFLIFAIAVGTAAHVPAALGGMLGGAGVVSAGWLASDQLLSRNLAPLRRVVGALLLTLAAWLGISAR